MFCMGISCINSCLYCFYSNSKFISSRRDVANATDLLK